MAPKIRLKKNKNKRLMIEHNSSIDPTRLEIENLCDSYIVVPTTPECIICLEVLDDNNLKTTFSSNLLFEGQINSVYFLPCNCKVSVHRSCMECWINKNTNCPICLTPLYKFEGFKIISKTGISLIGTLLIGALLWKMIRLFTPMNI